MAAPTGQVAGRRTNLVALPAGGAFRAIIDTSDRAHPQLGAELIDAADAPRRAATAPLLGGGEFYAEQRAAATTLRDGRVLVLITDLLRATASSIDSFVYDPAADAWTDAGAAPAMNRRVDRLLAMPDDTALAVTSAPPGMLTIHVDTAVSLRFDPVHMTWSIVQGAPSFPGTVASRRRF